MNYVRETNFFNCCLCGLKQDVINGVCGVSGGGHWQCATSGPSYGLHGNQCQHAFSVVALIISLRGEQVLNPVGCDSFAGFPHVRLSNQQSKTIRSKNLSDPSDQLFRRKSQAVHFLRRSGILYYTTQRFIQ